MIKVYIPADPHNIATTDPKNRIIPNKTSELEKGKRGL